MGVTDGDSKKEPVKTLVVDHAGAVPVSTWRAGPKPGGSAEALAPLFGNVIVRRPSDLQLIVGEDGGPRDIRVVPPVTPALDKEVIRIVSGWRFRPGENRAAGHGSRGKNRPFAVAAL